MLKGVMAIAKRYHSPGRIARGFISSLWLGWSSLLQMQVGWSRAGAQLALEARVVIDHSIVKAIYSPRFFLIAYKQKHDTTYEVTAALGLHKYQESFQATHCCKQEKPQNTVGKRPFQTVT